MLDPFRDELENARARMAQLEAENLRLKVDLDAARSLPGGQRGTGVPWSFVAFVGVMALGLVAMVSVALAPRAPSTAATPAQFPGVAIAQPVAAAPPPLPVASPPPPSRTSACACTAGDPLCTCIDPGSPWRVIRPARPTTASPADLALSGNPSDWQRAREILEPRVFGRRASVSEKLLLKAICKRQGDLTCVDVCKQLEPAPPNPVTHF
jgi:hypothetical protein